MQFCNKCGSMLIPKKEDEGRSITCHSCGNTSNRKQNVIIKEKVQLKKLDTVEVVDKKIDANPTIKEQCPKCNHHSAFYWTMQTRAGDEAETRFFECVKCHHRWRAYE